MDPTRRFICEICKRPFKIKRESVNAPLTKPIKCQKCQFSFVHKTFLKERRRGNKYENKCDECDASYQLKEDLKQHKFQRHNTMIKFKCHLCSYSAFNKKNMDRHVTAHENKGRFKCDKCDRSYNIETLFKSHRDSHLKSKNSEPDYRKNPTRNLKQPSLNVASVSNADSVKKCDKCGLILTDQSDSAIHRDAHRGCYVSLQRVPVSSDVKIEVKDDYVLDLKIELNDDLVKKENELNDDLNIKLGDDFVLDVKIKLNDDDVKKENVLTDDVKKENELPDDLNVKLADDFVLDVKINLDDDFIKNEIA